MLKAHNNLVMWNTLTSALVMPYQRVMVSLVMCSMCYLKSVWDDFHLMKLSDSRLLQSFLGFKLQMVVPWWLLDLFREVRFLFTAPTTCPWGAIGLFLIVLCCCSCLAGICIGAFAFSVQCRKFASGLVGWHL